MTVEEMLARMSSEELSHWMAFERVTGQVGSRYSEDMQASILEQLQLIAYILGEANSEEGTHPIPEPSRVKRPHQMFDPEFEDEEEPEEDDDDVTYDEAEFAKNFE